MNIKITNLVCERKVAAGGPSAVPCQNAPIG